MKLNFVGNFSRGYVGEKADETHLVEEMKNLGHEVVMIPRDEWQPHTMVPNEHHCSNIYQPH